MIRKILIGMVAVIGVSILGFVAGPRPQYEEVNNIPSNHTYDIHEIEEILKEREAKVANIKPDNQSQIIWADSSRMKTPYSIVYLHGFSASQGEGFPMHRHIADSIGANLYLPRLHGHGILDTTAMSDLTPILLVEDAKDAIAVGRTLGDKVIVMSCSTGGTLSIYLAANDPSIVGQILLSPNIEIASAASALLTGPWGKELAYQLIGPTRNISSGVYTQYWSQKYSTNGLIALQALLDQTMKPIIFRQLKTPVYCGYYYKNEEEQDPVVSVDAMLQFQKELTLAADDIEFEAFPEAGDHVISSMYKNDNWKNVENEVLDFINREIIN